MTFTDMSPKIRGILPLCCSQSPTCGDGHLAQAKAAQEAQDPLQESYIRAILSGNDDFFVVAVVDSGYVAELHNKPRELQNLPTFAEIAEQSGCILLHTSGWDDRGQIRVQFIPFDS